jgi:hypothetical protein
MNDLIPQSSASDGRWKIAYTPKGANPLSAAVLNGQTAYNVTYSFTPSGFPYAITQEMINDPRFALKQNLSRPGKISEALTLQYVDSVTPGSAAVLFDDGLEGQFTIRRGEDNDEEWAEDDIVTVIYFQLGIQSPDAPTENGVDTISQPVGFIDASKRKVPLAA